MGLGTTCIISCDSEAGTRQATKEMAAWTGQVPSELEGGRESSQWLKGKFCPGMGQSRPVEESQKYMLRLLNPLKITFFMGDNCLRCYRYESTRYTEFKCSALYQKPFIISVVFNLLDETVGELFLLKRCNKSCLSHALVSHDQMFARLAHLPAR